MTLDDLFAARATCAAALHPLRRVYLTPDLQELLAVQVPELVDAAIKARLAEIAAAYAASTPEGSPAP